MAAIPRNERKPATSVTVVRMIDEAVAGSWPNRVSAIGTNARAIPADTIASTIARAITSARAMDQLHK